MVEVTESQYREGAREALGGLVAGTPNAIFILAGTMKYDEANGVYVTGSFDTPDENSMLSVGKALPAGGRDRILSAFELHKVFPNAYLVTLSQTRDECKPTYAYIACQELLEKGVDPQHILLRDASVDTVTELKEVADLSLKRGWRNVVLITSKWQKSRTEALLNHIEDFADTREEQTLSSFAQAIKNSTIAVQLLDTAAVLSTLSDVYKDFFEKTLAIHPGILARIDAEANSVRQIAEGTYGGRTLTHKIWNDKI